MYFLKDLRQTNICNKEEVENHDQSSIFLVNVEQVEMEDLYGMSMVNEFNLIETNDIYRWRIMYGCDQKTNGIHLS